MVASSAALIGRRVGGVRAGRGLPQRESPSQWRCKRCARGQTLPVRSSKVFEWEEEAEDSSASAGEVVKGLATKVQTEAPLLGLLTKLFSPQGVTKGELTYQEFSRAIYDNVSSSFHISCENMEKRSGEMAGIRGCIYCLWVACYGTGLIKQTVMSDSCKQLRQNEDLAYFIELFEYQKEEGLKLRARTQDSSFAPATPEDKINAAVTNLCSLVNLSEMDGEMQNEIYEIVSGCFPSTEPYLLKGLISKHPKSAKSA